MTRPWTEETEGIVREALCDLRRHVPAEYEKTWARTILNVLAGAGLLVPRDADRREQQGVLNKGTEQVSVCPVKPCEHTEQERQLERSRTVVSFTTPWTTGSPE